MNYHDISTVDMMNGDGLRVVLWLSGCSHHCYNCQNPQTWSDDSGIPFDESSKEELFRELSKDYISGLTLTGGDPLFESNLDGVLDLVNEVNNLYKNYNIIDRKNDDRYNILNNNVDEIHLSSPKKSIWLYTGFAWENIFNTRLDKMIKKGIPGLSFVTECEETMQIANKRRKIVSQCDVLVDGRYIDSQRDISLPWRGSKNQRVIDIKRSLQEGEIVLHSK